MGRKGYICTMKSTFASVCLLASILLLASAAGAAETDLPIGSISVTGLRRTKERTVTQLLERYLGTPASSLDESEVSAILIGTGIFENVRAAAVPSGDGKTARLEVAVDEKWSILPIPVFAVTGNGLTAGAAFMDANAFGLNDKLMSIALLLPSGWMTSIAYMDEKARQQSRSSSYSASVSRKEQSDEDAEERTLRRYGSTAINLGYETSFSLFRETNASFALSFRERSVSEFDKTVIAEPDPARVLAARFGLSAKKTEWNGVFLSESFIDAGTSYSFALKGDPYYSLDARAALEKPVGSIFRLRAQGSGVFAPDSPPVFGLSPTMLGISVLPSNFSARSAASVALGAEARLIKFRFGLLSGLASYEADVAEGDLIGTVFAHGPSGGLRLYVAKVAFPAMSLVVSYNVETSLFKAGFGIGMRM